MQDYTYNHLYRYIGPVLLFDRVIASEWSGETKAPTARKAKSNLIYQFKKQSNRLPSSRITLPGEIKMVN
jgi:hypothetical protein